MTLVCASITIRAVTWLFLSKSTGCCAVRKVSEYSILEPHLHNYESSKNTSSWCFQSENLLFCCNWSWYLWAVIMPSLHGCGGLPLQLRRFILQILAQRMWTNVSTNAVTRSSRNEIPRINQLQNTRVITLGNCEGASSFWVSSQPKIQQLSSWLQDSVASSGLGLWHWY